MRQRKKKTRWPRGNGLDRKLTKSRDQSDKTVNYLDARETGTFGRRDARYVHQHLR